MTVLSVFEIFPLLLKHGIVNTIKLGAYGGSVVHVKVI